MISFSDRIGKSSVTSARLFSFLLLPLLLCSCVPYVKYEDAVGKLQRANRVNSDIEKRLRDSQLTGFEESAQLQRSAARIGDLETELQGLSGERVVLEDTIAALKKSLNDMPKVVISTSLHQPNYVQVLLHCIFITN